MKTVLKDQGDSEMCIVFGQGRNVVDGKKWDCDWHFFWKGLSLDYCAMFSDFLCCTFFDRKACMIARFDVLRIGGWAQSA